MDWLQSRAVDVDGPSEIGGSQIRLRNGDGLRTYEWG